MKVTGGSRGIRCVSHQGGRLSIEAGPQQRGPYLGRRSARSIEARLALRAESRPECKCGCGTQTRWLSSKCRWATYVRGHYRAPRLYHDPDWLREEYVNKRRTSWELATECGVDHGTILRHLHLHEIPIRGRSEARVGRMVGEKNPAWKGGVADWDYSPDWKALARAIRCRDEWTCRDCGEQRKRWGNALHVHHIDGDKLNNDPGNLISLCARCHYAAHAKEVMPL